MPEITHFANEEAGDFIPASEFVPGETPFKILRFSDGSVFDLIVHQITGNGWRGKIFPVWSVNVMRGDEPAPPQYLWTADQNA